MILKNKNQYYWLVWLPYGLCMLKSAASILLVVNTH